ncbi:MAG: TIR domain-containing protein [Pseudonocardiaceae bacterium]
MVDDHQLDFFVSYTKVDQAWAEWISLVLEEAGYRVVVQAWDFGAGNFMERMEHAVQNARRLLPVLSEAYLRSRYGLIEWTAFARDLSTIIPVQIEDIDTRSILSGNVRVNLRGLTERDATERLRSRIGELVGKPQCAARSRREARFPGIVAQIVPDAEDHAAGAPWSPRRITPEPGRVQLVILGSGEASCEAAAELPALFDVPAERTLDLYDSKLTAAEQMTKVTAVLGELDQDAVSDVIVVFAGRGERPDDLGIRLHVRVTDSARAATSIGLGDLLGLLEQQIGVRRAHLLVDATDDNDTDVGPTAPWAVPVLNLRSFREDTTPATGLPGLCVALTRSAGAPVDKVEHWASLSLGDIAVLSGGTLLVPPQCRGAEIGLAPNPLAWPRQPSATGSSWCFVLSATDARREGDTIARALGQLQKYRRGSLEKAMRAIDPGIELDEVATRCRAEEVFSSPAAFARAAEQVCRAEIAVFDVTNFEPAVMVLLGIRAVIRRGVTLCVHGPHAEPWQRVEPPFHLREVSLLAQPSFGTIGNRLMAGIKQLGQAGSAYSDLPSFDLIRAVPPAGDRRGPRSFDSGSDPSILALVPFDAVYTARHWSQLEQNLPAAAVALMPDRPEDEHPPRLLRTLDLDSPRVISAQLFEAIRLTDFCLVDLTGVRPNVMFELGVRLAANALHPVVVHDAAFTADGDAHWSADVAAQREQLCQLLAAIPYTPYVDDDIDPYRQMVARHLELRHLATRTNHPRAQTVLGGFPPSGLYRLAWRHAVPRDESTAMPVDERLITMAGAMLVDPSDGARRLIYPKRHRLSAIAEHSGREHLVAAWLYLHHRRQAYRSDDANLVAAYGDLTDRLIAQLESTGDDDDAAFVEQIDSWRTAEDKSTYSGWRRELTWSIRGTRRRTASPLRPSGTPRAGITRARCVCSSKRLPSAARYTTNGRGSSSRPRRLMATNATKPHTSSPTTTVD